MKLFRFFSSSIINLRGLLRTAFGLLALLIALSLAPNTGLTCACGCGIYKVGTNAMFPEGAGGTAFLESDYQDQNHNWSGTSQAPAANNPDKDIRTDFVVAGLQEMFNRSWGVQIEVPYVSRYFQTTGGATGQDMVSSKWSGLGDTRIEGIYTGFSSDLSTGVTFGLQIPTGDYTHNDAYGDVDRDSEIGTGSTDVLLGAFHRGNLTDDHHWIWFAQMESDMPVLSRDQYRPGWELDSAAGLYYRGWVLDRLTITPMMQAKFSSRASDRGDNAASPLASGFQRVLLAPGIEFHLHPVRVYADVERPVYQNFNGNQLSSSSLFKLAVSYMF